MLQVVFLWHPKNYLPIAALRHGSKNYATYFLLMSVSLTSFSIPDNGISHEYELIFNGRFQFFNLINKL